ncbi:MAG TPA: hypothetical protein VGM91_00290 [Conexibacter sp.]|jgi:hypothetical protein
MHSAETTVHTADDRPGGLGRRQVETQRLMATGLIGHATVRELRDTEVLVNDNPLIEFELLVSVEDRGPYLVTHRQVVSRLVLANFQPGTSIPVRVDPADPDRVLIG